MNDQNDSKQFLIYGATGYSGRLIVEAAVKAGLRPVVAGRDSTKVAALSEKFGLESSVFSVDDRTALQEQVRKAGCVVNAAGPFFATAEPIIDMCISESAHYIDITGELSVFAYAGEKSEDAIAADVMLMPGAGWDVVPTDCLALHTARRAQNPLQLRLGAYHVNSVPSRGSLRSGQLIRDFTVVRRDGELVKVDDPTAMHDFRFHGETISCHLIGLADVVTAWQSTGVPNIEVYMGREEAGFTLPEGGIDAMAEGPTEEELAKVQSMAVAEITDASGKVYTSMIETHTGGYTYTALAIVDIARRILDGSYTVGFQAPASAYGASLATDIGATITDLS
ncbi:MAG: saccharopine dehydrogenase NADP-binding domain-containing protein [Chloroflexota bacterium]|nr:saccharopine dehydrogenase NADP-binding domain-containing protein [Chloroflexota bacterium]